MTSSRRSFLHSLKAASFTIAMESLATRVTPAMAAALAKTPSSAGPYFVDVAAQAGLNRANLCGAQEKKHLLEATGCGVAFYDYDHDGWPDIFFVNGSSFAPTKDGTPTSYLFHNNR